MVINYINFFFAVFGIISSFAAIIGPGIIVPDLKYEVESLKVILCTNIVYLVFVGVEALLLGRHGQIVYIFLSISNFAQYFCLYVLSMMITIYMLKCVNESVKTSIYLKQIIIIYMIPILLLVVNIFTKIYYYIGEDNIYYRGKYFLLSQVLGVACHGIIMIIYVKHRENFSEADRFLFRPFIIIPVLGDIIQVFTPGINLMVISNTICTLMITIMGVFFWNIHYMKKEKNLEQMKISARVGEMWPEFTQNILVDVSDLCKTDPEEASRTIDHFADFLRKSMNDLSEVTLKPFKEEYQYLKNYLFLEKLRFGDKLEVNYDIETMDFEVPTQVLQQTAEWLVRYVMPDAKGSFVLMIHTEKMRNHYLIEFYEESDEEDYPERNQSSDEIGELQDIKKRLEIMPDSKFEYESTIDSGTMIKIYLKI